MGKPLPAIGRYENFFNRKLKMKGRKIFRPDRNDRVKLTTNVIARAQPEAIRKKLSVFDSTLHCFAALPMTCPLFPHFQISIASSERLLSPQKKKNHSSSSNSHFVLKNMLPLQPVLSRDNDIE
jgi:hypothetical protein